MKLLDAIRNYEEIDNERFLLIKKCINDRISWMEMREPEYDGSVYEAWEEKYDELQEIYENIEEYMENHDDDVLMDIVDGIQNYQAIYGGLSRLTI